jgi:hypothetical protein
MNIPVTVTEHRQVETTMTPAQIAGVLEYVAWEKCGKPDDAGTDWTTRGPLTLVLGQVVSKDPGVAALVDAAQYLAFGHTAQERITP